MMIGRVNSQINNKNYEEEQAENESIQLTQLSLKERLELEIDKSKRTIAPKTPKRNQLNENY